MKLIDLLRDRSMRRGPAANGAHKTLDASEAASIRVIGAEARQRYVAESVGRIEGWNGAVAFRFLDHINDIQKNRLAISGSVAEIGVHHGQFFVYLAMLRAHGERAMACDVFDQQELNKDGSGCGDRAIFEQNLREHLGSLAGIAIFSQSSDQLNHREIAARAGPIRLISIDGGHWRDIVINDLCVAASCLQEYGVAVLDDVLNPYWAGVSEGLACYLWGAYDRGRIHARLPATKRLVPFAVGCNKALLCFEDKYQQWIDLFEKFGPNEALMEKPLGWQGRPILLYRDFLEPSGEA